MRSRVFVLVLVASCAVGAAQQTTATITGTLLDPNGRAVANTGSSIHAKNTATQAEFVSAILPNGDFVLGGLPAGMYTLSVLITSAMYASYTQQESVTLKAGETLKMNIPIRWGINLGTIGDDPVTLANDMRAKAKVPPGPTPRMKDGKPDFNGLWVRVIEPPGPPNPVPLQPWAADIQKKLEERPGGVQSPQWYCLPMSALPLTLSFPHKIVQTSSVIVDLAEFDTPGYRQIFLDGRPHPKLWNPSWLGHSVGKWEGDTLMVDTVGFNELAGGTGIHTEKLHVVERIRRPEFGRLEVDITVEDPDAYTGPWKRSVKLALAPDEEILEFVCAENNKDPMHLAGLGFYTVRP